MTDLLGTRIHVNESKTRTTRRRTWAQRLFSWPWRPWAGEVELYEYLIPDGTIIIRETGMTMNPNTFAIFKGAVR